MSKLAIISINEKEYVMKFEGNIDMRRIDEEIHKSIKDIIHDYDGTEIKGLFQNIKFIFDVRCKFHYDLIINNKCISIIELD